MLQLIGEKCGMTRVFDENGIATPVTVVRVGLHQVTQVKTKENDGYSAVQLSSGAKKVSRVSKPLLGHYRKAKVEPGVVLFESVTTDGHQYELGQSVDVSIFEGVVKVDVASTSKGKGFAGGVKRHNFSMQDATHGNSVSHRAIGSTGQNQTPGRVFKGKKMAGQMGNEQVTIQSLGVVKVDLENNLLLIKGSVPGPTGALLKIKKSVKLGAQDGKA
jgi:large subunit ribosomal protein L3